MDNLLNRLLADQSSRTIELVGKFFIAMTAAAYFVGIIVVNVYLGQFGFYSLSLFRLNYVLAGFWAIVVIGLAYVLFELFFIALAIMFVKGIPVKDRASSFFVYAGGGFIFGCGVYAVAGILGVSIGGRWLVIPLIGILGIWKLTKEFPTILKRFTHVNSKTSTAIDTILSILLIGFYVVSFAGVLYPQIPANFGGGQPKSVQIIPVPAVRLEFDQLGLLHTRLLNDNTAKTSPPSSLFLSDTLSLLLSTDDELVFLLPHKSNQSVVLRKETISAIIFHKLESTLSFRTP